MHYEGRNGKLGEELPVEGRRRAMQRETKGRGQNINLRMFGKRKYYFTSYNHTCKRVYVHVYINVFVCV